MTSGHSEKTAADLGMELLVGYILLVGVLLSVLLLLAGMAWRWKLTGHPELAYTITGSNLLEFWGTAIKQASTLTFRPRLLVNLGIGVLMLTPYFRVLASFIYFAVKERNVKYAVFTGFVLAVLSYSLLLR